MRGGSLLLLIAFVCLIGMGLFSFLRPLSDEPLPHSAPTESQAALPESKNPSPLAKQPLEDLIEAPIAKEKISVAPSVAKKPAPTRRLMVFTPSGPLLLDLNIQIEGSSHKSKIRQFVDRLRKAADTNVDGKTTWEELIYNQSFLAGPLGGGGRQTSRTDRRRWRELYDIDGDGRVDRGEALTWFDREANGGKIGLTLLGQRAYTPSLVSSATWRTLDADGNGSLTTDEITGAPDRLRARDVNDDFIIVPAELLSLSDLTRLRLETGPGGNSTFAPSDTTFQAAMLLDREADTLDARNTLARMRVGDGGIYGEGAFGVSKQLFANVDRNANGQIGKSEWPQLIESPPHVRFQVRFPAAREPSSSSLVLEEQGVTLVHELVNQSVLSIAPASEGGHGLGGQGLGGQLLITVVDESNVQDTIIPSAELLLVFDTDADGSLNEEELQEVISSGQFPFGNISYESLLGYDTDGDKAASYEELAAYLTDTQARQRLSLTVVVNDAADPLFAALDLDGDGRLGEREIAESTATLATASSGESLRPGETPWLMRLTIYRTTRQLTPTESPPAQGSSRSPSLGPAKNLPVWFTGADTNRDGDLSRREFIGSANRFAELDTNRDGFISADEALRR